MTPNEVVLKNIKSLPASERHEVLVEMLRGISAEELIVAIDEIYDDDEIFDVGLTLTSMVEES